MVFTLPIRLPQPVLRLEGGGDKSAAGVPFNYIIRTEQKSELILRFYEDQWPAVAAWLEAVIGGSLSFTFRFDQNVPATEYTVYLEEPTVNEDITPEREEGAQWFGALELPVVLRKVTGPAFDVRIYRP